MAEHASAVDALPPPMPHGSERIYTEDEIQLECEGRYDQETFHQGYLDDECQQDLPHRYLTQWSLKVPSHLWMQQYKKTRDETSTNVSNNLPVLPLTETTSVPQKEAATTPNVTTQATTTTLNKEATTTTTNDAVVGDSSTAALHQKPKRHPSFKPNNSGYTCVPLPPSDEFLPNRYQHLVYYTSSHRKKPTSPLSPRRRKSLEHKQQDDATPSYYQHAILEGYLLPHPNYPNAPRLRVRLHALDLVCVDLVTPGQRGIWVYTTRHTPHAAGYWLQEPSVEQAPFTWERRAQLGVLSNVIDAVQARRPSSEPWAQQTPAALHQTLLAALKKKHHDSHDEPFSLELLYAFGRPLRRHLRHVFPKQLTLQSVLYKELGKDAPVNFWDMAHDRVTRLCQEAEARSQQHPWGGSTLPYPTTTLVHAIQQDVPKKGTRKKPATRRQVQDSIEPDWDALTRCAQAVRQTQRYQQAQQTKRQQRRLVENVNVTEDNKVKQVEQDLTQNMATQPHRKKPSLFSVVSETSDEETGGRLVTSHKPTDLHTTLSISALSSFAHGTHATVRSALQQHAQHWAPQYDPEEVAAVQYAFEAKVAKAVASHQNKKKATVTTPRGTANSMGRNKRVRSPTPPPPGTSVTAAATEAASELIVAGKRKKRRTSPFEGQACLAALSSASSPCECANCRSGTTVHNAKNKNLPPEAIQYLMGWMMAPKNVQHPYPSEEEKAEMMRHTGLCKKQLDTWFVNNRKRYWKQRQHVLTQMHQEQQQQETMLPTLLPPASAAAVAAEMAAALPLLGQPPLVSNDDSQDTTVSLLTELSTDADPTTDVS